MRRVARVLRISEHMGGEATDAGRVTGAERGEGESVSVLGTSNKNGVAEAIVRKRRLGPQWGTDSAAWTQGRLHPASLLTGDVSATRPCCGVPGPRTLPFDKAFDTALIESLLS